MNRETFAATISRLRNEKGLSQKELGDLLGVSNKAVSKWENGEAMPKTETLLKIADVFSLDISELMGGEAKPAPQPAQPTGEIDELKAENALLRSQLTAKNKKKKRSIILAIIICVAAIGASCLIAFITGSDLADNKDINDLGKTGTQIEFSGRTFEPATPIDKEVYGDDDYFVSKKEAEYTDLDGKKSKVLVHCDSLSDYVLVKKAGKNYFYIDSKKHIEISKKTVQSIVFIYGKTVAKKDDATLRHRVEFNVYDKNHDTATATFFEFYNNRKETKDARATELFLGNESCAVQLVFNENAGFATALVGEFFTGKDGKLYYYDYSDTKTYDVGWEVTGYVKGNQEH